MKHALNFATELARQTGELLMKYYQPAGIRANVKADHTAVTEADLAADALIRAAIKDQYPDDGLISEESGSICPTGKPIVWVVDPLDGTTNFSLGLHYWGVSIARLVDGEPDTAALYFPLLNELFTAQRGEGAFLNGESLQTKPPNKDNPFSFFICCSRTHQRYKIKVPYKTRILGSAAYGLCTVARGSAMLALEATPKIWDFAGSWLVTREAGGVVQFLDDGSPFPLIEEVDYTNKGFSILMAATPEVAARARRNITPRRDE
ncbi:MAG: inositol monophosphatase family protein [Chloroflexota bacterium]|nr:inositol monophosphatase family protein [Chloroflexota bacterium]